MSMSFYQRDLISIFDLSKEEILYILQHASFLKTNPQPDLLKGKILASCFFEPSTRTRLSFETAMLRLGGQVIGFSEENFTSIKKGETLSDSMRVIGNYADIIVLRTPLEGGARLAAEATEIPVINAGDGSNQHPTQTLLDLFTIEECQQSLENLRVALVGDLKYGRTVHSLALALSQFQARLYFVSPENLTMPEDICRELKKNRLKFSCHRTIGEVLDKCDILYMTRIQKERFSELEDKHIEKFYQIKPALLTNAKKTMRILHPLPRIDEIDSSVDATDFAYYFQQAENGVYVRQALLDLLLQKQKPLQNFLQHETNSLRIGH